MKTASRPAAALLLTLAASATLALWLRADDDALPKAPPAGRYDAMAERSPFTAPTAPVPTPPPAPFVSGPHWWDQMSVTSLMDRGGKYYAAVWDHAADKHYVLEINKTDEESQLLMSGVHWDERLDQTTVTVSKGTETAPPLKFDATASSRATVSPGMSMPMSPGMQAPFTPPPRGAPINPATLPAGFTGTPPPPPPSMPNVVRRAGPIGSNPPANPRNGVQQPANGPPRRIIVPNNSDGND